MIANFLEIPRDRHIGETEFFFLIYDAYPVAAGHILVITKTLHMNYFELTDEEKRDLDNAIQLAKAIIEQALKPDGYNIGMNCGAAAGQTVFHFHCHVIPRYNGDMDDPRGGVRHVIPSKGNYG